ncbi:MAG TPA: GntR family transcriptional regulator [Gaiellaceae bacterium]|jgi:DNA-binding GntR family transcriptional regulator|nr:GntR family transcriptional regulator [Gaiellaceae bacterium]
MEEPPNNHVGSSPRRVLLADDSYRILREALIANRLAPGQRLNIEQLAEDMNVSITPIRHALVRLEGDGLVTREPYKGYVVSRLLDRSTVSDIFDARMVIETEVVARAAERASKADVELLLELAELDPMSEVPPDDSGFDEDAPLNNDGVFHRRIALVAGNTIIVDTLDTLFKRMSAYRSFRLQLQRKEWSQSGEFVLATTREHVAIVRAIKRGNADSARSAMRKHLENARRRDIDPVADDGAALEPAQP